MARFSVDYLDLLLDLFRSELDAGVKVMTRIPDQITTFLPLVVIRASGGDSYDPRFFDTPYINVQSWCAPPPDQGAPGAVDASRAACDLADDCRRILWTAWRDQRVIAGLGWISKIRESAGPLEIPDVDAPALGRWVATYELRIRNAT